MINGLIHSSFRDPSGFLFSRDGSIYRQVNIIYSEDYDQLMSSGLYEALKNSGLLIPHEEVGSAYSQSDNAYKILKPELIPFISYPYEWCLSQLKDAALLTLKVQKKALDFGMTLKDCSAYNIQFHNGKPIFIDTLSFEKCREGEPWVAYKQFCQHFLAPLALMKYKDIRLNQLFRIYMDGIPLDLASSFLPFYTCLKFPLFLHVHVHAKIQKYFSDKGIKRDKVRRTISLNSHRGLIDSLESFCKKLSWRPKGTTWIDYYQGDSYDLDAIKYKKQLVEGFLSKSKPKTVWDIGSNTGMFSRIASDKGIYTVSFDIDPACVENNYLATVEKGETNILPLLCDLTNPSPNIGWENKERNSFIDRGPADTVLALAIVHHLAISNNLPLSKIADFFYKISSKSLIIEFVPKNDPKVQKLLASRDDIFPHYTEHCFESEFGRLFRILYAEKVMNSERTLYLMERK